MARISDRQLIERLEQFALIEPTNDASARAIDRAIERARQAQRQEQPLRRRPSVRVTLVAVSCAAALLLLLVPVVNHLRRDPPPPAAHGPAVAGPAARSSIPALPGAVPEHNEAPGSGPVARTNLPAPGGPAGSNDLPRPAGPSGPAGPPVRGGKPRVAGEPLPPVVPAKPRSQEANRPPNGKRDDKAGFESVTASFKAPLSRKPPEQVRIDGDGSCLYTIDELAARGQESRLPAAILKSRIDARKLVQLEQLLEKTDWLKAAGGEGRALHTDAGEVKITLVRDGKTRTITCLGNRPEPYRSLLWFFQGIVEQEFRLHQLTCGSARERDDACRAIRSEIAALTGQWGQALPYYDFDYRRYLAPLAKMVREPAGIPEESLVAAVKLVAYVDAESELEFIAKLEGVSLRSAVAEAIADFGGARAVPVLARLAPSNMEALWGLIRLGEIAVPTLVSLIEPGTTPPDVTSREAVRAYIEHWNELPEPVDERVVKAAREAMARTVKRSGRNVYYEAFLKLVESDPVPPAGLSCRIERSSVSATLPLRFIHGWYVVADGRIVEQHAAAAPEPGTKYFDLKFDGRAVGHQVHLQTDCRPTRPGAGGGPVPEIKDAGEIDAPEGARLEVVYSVWTKHEHSNNISPVRVTTQYRTLWEGRLVKDGQTRKRIVYVARIAKADEPLERLWPPAAPAAPRGELAPPPLVMTFRGVTLSDKLKLTDPAVLHDLAIAGRNDAIREQGGTPTDRSRTEVTDKSSRDDAGREFVVYRDPKLKLDYVQVIIRKPGEPLKSLFYGPLEEGRLKKADPSREEKREEK